MPVSTPGGTLTFKRRVDANLLVAAALTARHRDRFAFAAAGGARRDVDERSQDRLLHAPHFARAVARAAALGRRARLGAFARTARTGLVTRHFDFTLEAEGRFFERDRHVVAQIGTAPGRAPRGRRGALPAEAEELFEDIAQAAEAGKVAAEAARAAHAAAIDRRVPEAIVRRALVVVRQHLVRFVQFLELRFGVVRLVHVGMMLPREFAVGLFDVIRAGALRRRPALRSNRACELAIEQFSMTMINDTMINDRCCAASPALIIEYH